MMINNRFRKRILDMKTCVKCHHVKDLSSFYNSNDVWCIECRKTYANHRLKRKNVLNKIKPIYQLFKIKIYDKIKT